MNDKPTVAVLSVTNAQPHVLEAHLQSILRQDAEADLTLNYVVDPSADRRLVDLLSEAGANAFGPQTEKPADAQHAVTEQTHEWSEPTFHWLAREKQALLEAATEEDFDYVWFVDSDLLCGPETLRSLLDAEREVCSAVFWTRWQKQSPPMPQVWLQHPYGLSGQGLSEGDFLLKLQERGLLPVLGLGACTLIRSDVFDRVRWWPLVEGLPSGGMWQGEDRHFCVQAARNHVPLWADAWPDIFHCYRPSDETQLPEMLEALSEPRPERPPRTGELVSFTLEACEEPGLFGYRRHMRGRLGSVRILPEIEAALRDLTPGDDALVRVYFPSTYPLRKYADSRRLIRIRLLDWKPFSFAPTLSDDFRLDG